LLLKKSQNLNSILLGLELVIKISLVLQKQIQENDKLELKMLHFFINTGINDTAYYWNELVKCIKVYIALKESPTLDSLNIGGGFQSKFIGIRIRLSVHD
jgi:diaminopimelate decarboxylase